MGESAADERDSLLSRDAGAGAEFDRFSGGRGDDRSVSGAVSRDYAAAGGGRVALNIR